MLNVVFLKKCCFLKNDPLHVCELHIGANYDLTVHIGANYNLLFDCYCKYTVHGTIGRFYYVPISISYDRHIYRYYNL